MSFLAGFVMGCFVKISVMEHMKELHWKVQVSGVSPDSSGPVLAWATLRPCGEALHGLCPRQVERRASDWIFWGSLCHHSFQRQRMAAHGFARAWEASSNSGRGVRPPSTTTDLYKAKPAVHYKAACNKSLHQRPQRRSKTLQWGRAPRPEGSSAHSHM